jgi:membrane fusion protein (multidrug efflux system)
VERGALLYTLESQPFEAEVAAKMSMVAEAKTMLAKARSDLDRIKPLAEQRAVSESDLDSAVALYEASVASVEAAEANLRAANIQLGYTKISSPISGIIGKTQAKVGDFVGRSPNPVILNVVSRIDTVLVDFFITEKQYLEVMRKYLSRELPSTGRQREQRLELILADGSLYGHKGKVDFIDREVDASTGAILVQASFPNPDGIIRPGQFARVKMMVDILDNGIMVPQRCVTELQGLYRVYIVNDTNEVEIRDITVGPRINNFWLITEGLDAGEKIVYEGLQRVRAGMTVNPVYQEVTPIAPENR